MDNYQEKQLIEDVATLKKMAELQANTLTVLLAVSRTAKLNPKDIEVAVDALPLHPANAASLKREAKKLIPIYFP